MSLTFTKLFSSITESTIWCEPANTRLVWITMLAMADRKGRVWASIPGLANRARVPLEDTEKALATLLSPDRYSRTPDNEGRRIEPMDGGWRLLNHEKYRAIRDEETTREVAREHMRRKRAAENVDVTGEQLSAVIRGSHNAEAEAEADREGGRKRRKPATSCPDAFNVTEAMSAWAVEQGLPANRVMPETAKFLDYFRGSGRLQHDWLATWRNWIRKAVEIKGGR